MDDAIVSQGERDACRAEKRVVVVVVLLIPLSGHTGVAHDTAGVLRQTEAHQMCRPWPLIDCQMTGEVVGDAGGIRASLLGSDGQCGDESLLLGGSQAAFVIVNSKQAAHDHTSPSAVTGSLM